MFKSILKFLYIIHFILFSCTFVLAFASAILFSLTFNKLLYDLGLVSCILGLWSSFFIYLILSPIEKVMFKGENELWKK